MLLRQRQRVGLYDRPDVWARVMTPAPPNIADLEWADDGTAAATDGYWELHRAAKTHLAKAGLRVEKTASGAWRVRFRASETNADAVRDGIAAAREARVVVSISMSDVERRNREQEDQRRRAWASGADSAGRVGWKKKFI